MAYGYPIADGWNGERVGTFIARMSDCTYFWLVIVLRDECAQSFQHYDGACCDREWFIL